MTATPRFPSQVRHAAARSRVGVAVGSIAACVALTGGLAFQHLGASTAASGTTPSTTPTTAATRDQGRGYGDDYSGDDNGFQAPPFNDPNNGFGNGGFVPNPGGGNTTSQGS